VYVHWVVVQLALPCPGLVEPVTVSVSPSESLSFASTFTVTGVAGEVAAVSSTALGAGSFVAVKVVTLDEKSLL
jgi:hypothetical protein